MKENEAIEIIKYRIDTASEIVGKGEDGNSFEDLELAIKALEEIKQYRAIGTIEEIKDLKVKNSEFHNEVQAINATMSLFEEKPKYPINVKKQRWVKQLD